MMRNIEKPIFRGDIPKKTTHAIHIAMRQQSIDSWRDFTD